MEVLRRTIELHSREDYIKLTPLGDVHAGARACDEEAFTEWVSLIANDPTHYTILMGDLADCILPDDRRFDPHEIVEWLWKPANRGRIADAQYEWLYNKLRLIPPNRILGILTGNHEEAIRLKHHRDLSLDLARNLNVPYLSEQAIIQLNFGRTPGKGTVRCSRNYDIHALHGRQSGRKAGGKVNLIQDLTFVDADLHLMGHVHDKNASWDTKVYLDSRGRYRKKERLYVLTGTFLKTYVEGSVGYGAKANYRPTAIGPVTVHIKPFQATGNSCGHKHFTDDIKVQVVA